jgi:hypothetical protein
MKNNQICANNAKKLCQLIALITFTLMSGCSSYKTSWDCPKVRGIGCSSVNYADEMAMEQILLNTSIKSKKNILINQSSLDPLDDDYQKIEIGN